MSPTFVAVASTAVVTFFCSRFGMVKRSEYDHLWKCLTTADREVERLTSSLEQANTLLDHQQGIINDLDTRIELHEERVFLRRVLALEARRASPAARQMATIAREGLQA